MAETNSEKAEPTKIAGIKVIKNFDAHSSTVELVKIDGKEYILKTVDLEEAWNEKRFLQTLKDNNLPSLEVLSHPNLSDNQILLEYIPDSKHIEWHDPKQVEQWARAVRAIHQIKFDSAIHIDSQNQEIILDWNTHLKKVADEAINSRLGGKTEMTDEFLEQIRDYVSSRLNVSNQNFSLVHGDLHDGNTLVRNGEVILYDKGSEVFSGDPVYDLTIIMTHFPNGVYVNTDDENYAHDSELLKAFIKGYGEDFIRTQKDKLDLYMVIRALDRYPNPFETFNKEIIEGIVKHD